MTHRNGPTFPSLARRIRSAHRPRAWMLGLLVLGIAGLVSSAPAPALAEAPASSPAVTVDDEYRSLMRELLQVTGSLELGMQMADGVVESMLASMRATEQPVPPRVEEIIRTTARELFGKIFGDEAEIVRVQAQIYSRHFTKAELRELLAFYATPIGSKAIQVMPQILNEGMAYGQQKAQRNMAQFQQLLMQRLEAEGLAEF